MIGSDRSAPNNWYRLPKTAAPLFSLAGLPAAFLLALALCWPVAVTGQLSAFADTNSYLKGGDAIWRLVGETLMPKPALVGAANVAEPGSQNAPDSAATGQRNLGDTSQLYGRSITYAAIFGGVVRTAGALAMTYLQAFMISLAIVAMIGQRALERPVLLGAGLVVLVAASPVAWMSVYLMPDVLAAVVLIFAALLVDRFDAFNTGQKIVLTILTAFSVSAHYGNIPLALAVVGAALVWRAISRRSRVAPVQWRQHIAAGLFVVAAAPLLNVVASIAVMGEPSVTPLRPPVVLARSIEDGPARWYLEERCAEGGADYCAAFEAEIPQTHHEFLWGERGLVTQDGATASSLRDNEWRIVLDAALQYPRQQIAATIINTLHQLTLVSESGASWVWTGEEFERGTPREGLNKVWIKRIMQAAVIASIVVLLGLLLTRRLDRPQVRMLGLICFGLLVNAFVFGALSAPADRYQARVAWLLPLLAVLFLAETGFGRRPFQAGDR